MLQSYEVFRRASTGRYSHASKVGGIVLIWINQLGCKYLCADFDGVGLVGCVAVGNGQCAVCEVVLQLMRHREDHGILRQPFCEDNGGSQIVIEVGAAQTLELVRPQVDANALDSIDSAKVRAQYAWSGESKAGADLAGEGL